MKRWTALLLVITLLSGILSFAAVAEDADMQPANDKAVTRTQCNVREDRDVDSAKLRNLEWGKKLTVIGYFDDGWCKVIYNDSGDTGYVKESWLYVTRSEESIPATKSEAKDAEKEETAKPEDQKETASEDEEEESSADTEEALAERDDPREEESEDEEDTGFPDEVETDPSVEEKTEAAAAEEESTLVAVQAEDRAIVNTPCNAREAHDLESKKIHSMSKGAVVTIVEYYNDGWCKIEYSKEHYGYARISWFDIPGKNPEDIPQDVTPSVEADPGTPVWDTEGRGSETPKFTEAELENTEESSYEGMDIRDAPLVPEGIEVGESDNDEMRYIAMTLKKVAIWSEPTNSSRRLGEIKTGKKVRVLAFGDEWCKIRTWDGQVTGYAKSKYIFHYHSMDPYKYELPWYNGYRPSGYIIVTKPIHVTDKRNLYKGHMLQKGDMVCVQLRDDGDYNVLVRRCWTTVPAEFGEYHPFVNWSEAKKGDIIGGNTLFYGLTQGHGTWKNRVYNINKAMGLMDGVVIGTGKKYSYLKNLGPVTAKNGWKLGGVIHKGSKGGVGIGGGICHTSSLTYFSVISFPVFIWEREPHTDDGTHYMPVEFDATVGAWSDFVFYNILPYDIKQHAFVDKRSGTITVYYECLETKTKEEIENFDWKKLPLPLAKDDK
jgi:uncharacterized protein YgiM (DUF1202 family)